MPREARQLDLFEPRSWTGVSAGERAPGLDASLPALLAVAMLGVAVALGWSRVMPALAHQLADRGVAAALAWVAALAAIAGGMWAPEILARRNRANDTSEILPQPDHALARFARNFAATGVLALAVTAALAVALADGLESARASMARRFLWPIEIHLFWLSGGVCLVALLIGGPLGFNLAVARRWLRIAARGASGDGRLSALLAAGCVLGAWLVGRTPSEALLALMLLTLFVASAVAVLAPAVDGGARGRSLDERRDSGLSPAVAMLAATAGMAAAATGALHQPSVMLFRIGVVWLVTLAVARVRPQAPAWAPPALLLGTVAAAQWLESGWLGLAAATAALAWRTTTGEGHSLLARIPACAALGVLSGIVLGEAAAGRLALGVLVVAAGLYWLARAGGRAQRWAACGVSGLAMILVAQIEAVPRVPVDAPHSVSSAATDDLLMRHGEGVTHLVIPGGAGAEWVFDLSARPMRVLHVEGNGRTLKREAAERWIRRLARWTDPRTPVVLPRDASEKLVSGLLDGSPGRAGYELTVIHGDGDSEEWLVFGDAAPAWLSRQALPAGTRVVLTPLR